MQIYEKRVRPVKSETMNDTENGKTYAIFDTAVNRKKIKDLQNTNAKVFLFPPIAAEKSDLTESATEIFDDLTAFDWLIFSDVLAVEYFLEILQEKDFDLYELDNLRICAIGEAVSDALRFSSIHADVIPSKNAAPETLQALLEYVGEAEIDGLRFLYLTGEASETDLCDKLRVVNAEVLEMPIYRINDNENSELTKLKTLLKGGAIDEFVLTAPTDLIALSYYFNSENLAAVFAEVAVSALDGVMFQTAREYDLRRVGLFHLDKVAKVN